MYREGLKPFDVQALTLATSPPVEKSAMPSKSEPLAEMAPECRSRRDFGTHDNKQVRPNDRYGHKQLKNRSSLVAASLTHSDYKRMLGASSNLGLQPLRVKTRRAGTCVPIHPANISWKQASAPCATLAAKLATSVPNPAKDKL